MKRLKVPNNAHHLKCIKQPRPLLRPSSLNCCQHFWNLSHETVPLNVQYIHGPKPKGRRLCVPVTHCLDIQVFKGKWRTPAARLSTSLNDNNTVWMSIRPQTCIQQFVQYGNSWLTFSTNKMGLRHTTWKTVSKIIDMIEIWGLISITKYLYIKSTKVYVPSLASKCVPPPGTKGGGHTRLRVRGWGSPNSDDWRKA